MSASSNAEKELVEALEELFNAVIDILNDPEFQGLIPKKYRFLLPIVVKIAKAVLKLIA